MQADARSLEMLNDALTAELTAVNQYFLHSKLCADWGYPHLAGKLRSESFGEMKHAEAVIDRILMLDGHPNLQRLNSLLIGENVPEALRADLELELTVVAAMRSNIAECISSGDAGTRELFEMILHDSEEHVDWLETQLRLIGDVGEAHYLAQQIRD
jgi:bacterioferritin